MLQCVQTVAPAKINIGLQVFPKRADGFHNIASIFTTVALADKMTVSISENSGCIVECKQMQLPSENTLTKTYKAFCVLTGVSKGVFVQLEKNIPSGGGLGGGYSDASSFIQALDSLFSTNLTEVDKNSISDKVGSDVFFFTQALLKGEEKKHFAAFVSGRGESVIPIPCRDDYSVVLLFPQVSVSTVEAYNLLDNKNALQSLENVYNITHPFVEQYKQDVAKWKFRNDFTMPICSRYPEIQQALKAVKAVGADFADMSGSGSTVFGIFVDKNQAIMAQKKLAKKWCAVLA